jgi:hypothetical protein
MTSWAFATIAHGDVAKDRKDPIAFILFLFIRFFVFRIELIVLQKYTNDKILQRKEEKYVLVV